MQRRALGIGGRRAVRRRSLAGVVALVLSTGLLPLAPYLGLLVQLASYEWWSAGLMTAFLLSLGFPLCASLAGFADRDVD